MTGRLLETERLIGEPANEGHRDVAVALFGDPKVAAWIWPEERGGRPRTPEQAGTILERVIAHWERDGFGWWFLTERASGERVGEVALQRTDVEGEPEVEVGWTMFPAHWNQGYATEAGRAAVAYAFEAVGLPDVVSFTLPHNVASRRVMEKLGMTYERDIERAGLPHVLYRLAAPQAAG
jgi:ribosomal-protein-alanine N-acetyltransferase